MTGDSDTHPPIDARGWLTVPNLVSGLRVLAVPYFWYVLIGQDRVGLAAALIFLIGSTDWIDGYLARRLNQVSEFGKLLDPLADRLMIASALIGGLVAGVLPGVIGWPLLAQRGAGRDGNPDPGWSEASGNSRSGGSGRLPPSPFMAPSPRSTSCQPRSCHGYSDLRPGSPERPV